MAPIKARLLTALAVVGSATLLAVVGTQALNTANTHDALFWAGIGAASTIIPALLLAGQYGRPGYRGYLRSLLATIAAAALAGAIPGGIAGSYPFAAHGTLIGAMVPFALMAKPPYAILAVLCFFAVHHVGKLQHGEDPARATH